jgi:aryl-alcohol dehydrogenase-like predicted oxidoreductase
LPFYPLASGLLTGKYRRGAVAPAGTRLARAGYERWLEDADFDAIEALEAFAAERGVSLLDVAIGGLAAKPAVASVIAGATSAEQVAANVKAGQWVPSDDELTELDRITA